MKFTNLIQGVGIIVIITTLGIIVIIPIGNHYNNLDKECNNYQIDFSCEMSNNSTMIFELIVAGSFAIIISVYIYRRQEKLKHKKESNGRLFILSKLDWVRFELRIVSGETKATFSEDTPEGKAGKEDPMLKKWAPLRILSELKDLNGMLQTFSDVIDYSEIYPLLRDVQHQMKIYDVYKNELPTTEFETMGKIFERHYKYWEKYKTKDYDMNVTSAPEYPES